MNKDFGLKSHQSTTQTQTTRVPECWTSTYMDDRMTHGTYHDRQGTVVGNYRPIACLPLM